MNKWIGIGRAGSDPEIRYTQDGTPVAQFNLATTKTWKGKNGQRNEKTTWHKIIAWRKLAEVIGQYIKKGSLIYVEGELEIEEYEAKDGSKRKTHQITINVMEMLGGKSEGGSSPQGNRKPAIRTDEDFVPEDEDVPL